MKYKLLNPNPESNTVNNILHNRGVKNVDEYNSFSWDKVNPPNLLGERQLYEAASALRDAIKRDIHATIVVDCDCDGFCSSALLTNYLYRMAPIWADSKLHHIFHKGKQHGLSDTIDEILESPSNLIIVPDAGSNDYDQHEELFIRGYTTIILDHHLADMISDNAIIINNQLSKYPNKDMSGVGIVWQFCRYLDTFLGNKYSNDYIDLVALGQTGDMMSLLSEETKFLIKEGFKSKSIKNIFLTKMIEKNQFSLNKPDYIPFDNEVACTIMGAAFFIVPFINAVNRSGTLDEKKQLFRAMIDYHADDLVLSNKRGHMLGEKETLVEQTVRMLTNIKNRQTKAEESGMEKMERKIQNEKLLDHKVLAIKTEEKDIDPELRGLIANKLMAKYQRPCIIVADDGESCNGSMRGYTKTGITDFKEECEKNGEHLNYVEGHQNAAGISIKSNEFDEFVESMDDTLAAVSNEPMYYVDYAWLSDSEIEPNTILEIAKMNPYWGQDIERSKIYFKVKVTPLNFAVMKSNTLKITSKSGVSFIKFGGTDKDIENLTVEEGYKIVGIVGKCNINEWNGKQNPQIIIEDYEVLDIVEYDF